MSSGIILPRPHALRAQWAALNFYPLPGSGDRITVAVVAMEPGGSAAVVEAPGLSRLTCLFGEEGQKYIDFVRLGIEALRGALQSDPASVGNGLASFGSSLELGPFQHGSGDTLADIAQTWLGQTSLLSTPAEFLGEASEFLQEEAATIRSPKVMPAIREEMANLSPFLVRNFGTQFHPAGKALPVRLGYKGSRIVADFSRLSAPSIGASLEKVRGKLWILAEHRDQTAHETYREHEMLVLRRPSSDDDLTEREISILDRACDDLLEEADRRDIRFRSLGSPREAAAHIFQTEMAA